MRAKITYTKITNIGIGMLLILSMLVLTFTELAGFPLYSLLLLIIVLGWMAARMYFFPKAGKQPWLIKYDSDLLVAAVFVFEILAIIIKLFQNPSEGDIGIVTNAVVIAFVGIYFLLSNGFEFRGIYFDLILYSGLLVIGVFLFPYFTETQDNHVIEAILQTSGKMASYLMLVSMISVYQYCVCRDKVRSWCYLLISVLTFLALFLNQNVISFWLMTIYFLAIPIVLRPTAMLIKRDMQMFLLFGFMLSNMSLLTGYTDIIQKEVAFSLEHSVYLELLLAIGGVFFFHYWDRIPDGVDLERLVMRKMRKGYQFLLKAIGIIFVGILLGGDRWASLPETMGSSVMKGFAVPLISALKQEENGFYAWVVQGGLLGSIVVVIFLVLMLGRMRRNYQLDKPYTGILILISSIFMLQLLFWNPGIQTYVVYFVLLLEAAFYKEERVRVTSMKVNFEEKRSKIENEKGEECGHV